MILAVDPGMTTGLATAEFTESEVLITIRQEEWDHRQFYTYLNSSPWQAVIIEDFEYRPGKARPNLVLYPVELIGIAHLWSEFNETDRHLYVQKAATGKGHWSDANLKAENLYVPGTPHGRDAERHLLHWLKFGAGSILVGERVWKLKTTS